MTQRFNYKILIPVAVALGVVLATLGLTQGWFSRTGLTKENQAPIDESNTAQGDSLKSMAAVTPPQTRPAPPNRQSDDQDEFRRQSSTGEAPLQTDAHKEGEGEVINESTARAPKPMEKTKLVAGNTVVKETERGPVATFQFSPTTTDPIGSVMIIAFLPPGSDAKILDLSPTDGPAYSKIDKRMSDNGWFAAFQGTPQELTNLSFHLAVSQPVTATIKGNCGIEPFNIELRPQN